MFAGAPAELHEAYIFCNSNVLDLELGSDSVNDGRQEQLRQSRRGRCMRGTHRVAPDVALIHLPELLAVLSSVCCACPIHDQLCVSSSCSRRFPAAVHNHSSTYR